ncbi:adenosylcobinamide-GDP ribazoletransferase [Thermaurantiacus sp.]
MRAEPSPVPVWVPPLLALQFLTRLPVPFLDRLSADAAREGLRAAVVWFPLAGALIGAITALAILVGAQVWPLWLAVLVALAFEAWLTGAFHEDAVADFCDALGGGHDAESTLRILKDSRIGSFGAVGLVLAVALRAGGTAALPLPLLAAGVVAAATFGRLLIVAAMVTIPPPPAAPGPGLAKDVAGTIRPRALLPAMLLALPGLAAIAALAPERLAVATGLALIFLLWLRRLLLRRIGGATGDCLGFAAYSGQLILLLVLAAR